MKSLARLSMNTRTSSCFPQAGKNLVSRRGTRERAYRRLWVFALSGLGRHVFRQTSDRDLAQYTQHGNRKCDVASENFTSMPAEDLPMSESYTLRELFMTVWYRVNDRVH
jgi:hypothetical protein